MDILSGRVAAIACCALLILTAAPVPDATGQLSPGALAESHKDLEGLKNCLKCHQLGAGPSAEKCLACHEEINVGIKSKRGYHHQVVTRERRACFECHGEHAGRAFEMIHWPGGEKNFEHQKTGLPLEGKHKEAKCRKCHQMKFIKDDPRTHQAAVDLKRTFLGLRKECLGCHFDEHRKQLSEDCTGCHDYEAWNPQPKFNHDKTRYRLTGRHSEVKCRKCHAVVKNQPLPEKPSDRSFVNYGGLEFKNCTPCHADIHKGKFKNACKQCHTTAGWQHVNEAEFDHSVTRFPLLGLHARVKCDKCHTRGSKLKRRRFASCADCHSDVHRGQFAKRSHKGKCEHCHSVDGFTPATFTVADHNKGRFRLTGAHRAQPCIACHKEELDRKRKPFRRYVMSNIKCSACHEDVHGGQFRKNGRRKGCDSCHGTTEWSRLVFDHNRHSSFKIEGKHANVRCSGCHKKVRTKKGLQVKYRPIKHSCNTCHDIEGMKL